jgi:hypothetical protein
VAYAWLRSHRAQVQDSAGISRDLFQQVAVAESVLMQCTSISAYICGASAAVVAARAAKVLNEFGGNYHTFYAVFKSRLNTNTHPSTLAFIRFMEY